MLDRRKLLSALAAAGVTSPAFYHALGSFSQEAESEISLAQLQEARWVSGVEMSDEELEEIVQSVERTSKTLASLREIELTDDVPMAIHFTPIRTPEPVDQLPRRATPTDQGPLAIPLDDSFIAHRPVTELSWMVKNQKISSRQLTELYLQRLKKYAPLLRCVVTLTEERALQQADRADQEIKAGNYRGPLHGIPWGAKDLIAIQGYPTTWGIPARREIPTEVTATVAQRLEEAGAVLVAKLSLGALARGDQWFEGMTRSPWYPKIGSSGSSAGSASAVVAGLVGFSLGSETMGSLITPSRRCGASALRPTFGRVSRHGCMPLSWSLDKIGPVCRSIEDCALVFDAIHGADGFDKTAGNYEFSWPSEAEIAGMKIGYAKSSRRSDDERRELQILKDLGCELVELELPTNFPLRAMMSIISIEAASVFEDSLKAGEIEGWNDWPKDFRAAQFISAVDYVRIQRCRTKLMSQFEKAIEGVDALVQMNDLLHTNFTGHPSIVMPMEIREIRERDGKFPSSLILTGHLHDDERLMKLGSAVQAKLDAHKQTPDLDAWLERFESGTLDESSDDDEK